MSTPIASGSSKPNPRRALSEDQRDPGSSTVSLAGSISRNRSTSVQRRKSKPSLKKHGSVSHPKLIYSVDDDINEQADENGERPSGEEQDPKNKNDKDYLEGYNDALRAFQQRKNSKSPMRSYQDISDRTPLRTPLRTPDELADIESVIARDLHEAEQNIRRLKATDPKRFGSTDKLDLEEDIQGEDNDVNGEDGDGAGDADENGSIHSNSSTESLNLKDRQNAINETHPFGIKIWKPSLYKKKRSVATRADEDIHDFDPRRPTSSRIFWGVRLTNLMWSLTAGLLIYVSCLIGALFVFVFSGFAIGSGSRLYVRAFLRLGRYWLYPFGKFVLLNKDKNYMDEDQLEGRTLNEFHQWRLQEEGRLFFAPPRRYTGSAEESTPLMKDHRGRPLRDAYNSLAVDNEQSEQHPDGDAYDNDESNDIKVRFFGRGDWTAGRIAFYLYFYVIVQPISYFFGFLSWLIVFTIPMANITSTLNDHVRRHPLALDFEMEKAYYKRREKDPSLKKKKQMILLCTYRCCGWHYYKYTIDGTNIFFINLLFMVLFVIVDFYFLKESLHWKSFLTDSNTIFCLCLFSIIPLAYFIGQAVASISAQSSMGVGAVINAFFSTIVEIFLYCVALNQSKGKLVEGSMIGSILGGVLLLPGLSMCGGALKRKTQRYNPRSAGVSSTMLLFAMVTMFAPSLFYQIYGSYEIKCNGCDEGSGIDDCTKCRFTQPSFTLDPLYYKVIKPFSLIVAIALFAAYVCGLFFTLRTHASLIWATNSHEAVKKEEHSRMPSSASIAGLDQGKRSESQQRLSVVPPRNLDRRSVDSIISASEADVTKEAKEDAEEGGGHDAPNWSKKKSTIILLGATVLYAIIAEILVDNVDSILADFPIDPKFLGLTIFALVPNTTEFLNAISFAIGGNVALSMEIGSAYALQVVLIQIPSLVVYSVLKDFVNVEQIFSLVFPRWDIIATLISIYLFTYIYAEGKSNYFKGVILILIYLVVMIGFWFNGIIDGLDDGLGDYSVLWIH